MLGFRFAVGAAVLALSASPSFAESIGPGKYSGIVIFDRWGGCLLYHGVGVLYISEAIKEELKGEAGKCIEVDATEVEQRLTLLGALIKKLTVLGPAPPAPAWALPEGMKLVVAPAFAEGHAPEFIIRLENGSPKPITVTMDHLGPTVLGRRDRESPFGPVHPADGPSEAVVTSQSLWTFWLEPGGKPRLKIGGSSAGREWQWKVTQPLTYERSVTVQPDDAFEVRMSFELPAGEYEFLAGYGGNFSNGRCIASKLIAFDVKADGTASLAKVAGR